MLLSKKRFLRKSQNEKKRKWQYDPAQCFSSRKSVELKKENYELRNERNALRKDRDQLATKLKAREDKFKKLEVMVGDDEELLEQLYFARKGAKDQRKKKRLNKR